ncbi:hypothetical protein ABFV83_10940 [Lacrimispora sp. BS-2]|uniref:Uncharacterized protein n=1 Tax=Lacrimispora sp. BS-2 TaxID=3151850 RepID=A0AAU7PKK3_9FIRM
MLNFIMAIVMILFGGKLVITPVNQLVQQFPKMPSPMAAKIVGGIAAIIGIGIFVVQILMWLGKI